MTGGPPGPQGDRQPGAAPAVSAGSGERPRPGSTAAARGLVALRGAGRAGRLRGAGALRSRVPGAEG